MAYYSPRQKTNGKWHYTMTNSVGIFDIGYCDSCAGHDTAEQASDHYREYQIDHAKKYFSDDTQKRCCVCGNWTNFSMCFTGEIQKEYYLCEEHCDKTYLTQIITPQKEEEKPCKEHKNKDVYVPKDFDEAVDYLLEHQVAVEKPGFHFGAGMSMRNNWGLWHNETALAKWFTEKKLFHGDDRSAILADAVQAKLKGEHFDVDTEIKKYQDWWLKTYGEKCSVENMEKEFHSYALE